MTEDCLGCWEQTLAIDEGVGSRAGSFPLTFGGATDGRVWPVFMDRRGPWTGNRFWFACRSAAFWLIEVLVGVVECGAEHLSSSILVEEAVLEELLVFIE